MSGPHVYRGWTFASYVALVDSVVQGNTANCSHCSGGVALCSTWVCWIGGGTPVALTDESKSPLLCVRRWSRHHALWSGDA